MKFKFKHKAIVIAGLATGFLWFGILRFQGTRSDAKPAPAMQAVPLAPTNPDGSSDISASSLGALPLFALLDHNDEPFPPPETVKGLIILFVSNEFRDQTTLWSDYLEEHLPPGCVKANVLDLRSMTRAMKSVIRMRVNAEAKNDKPHVWLDWDGALADHLGASLDQLNIICFDAEGKLLKHSNENFSEQAADEILALYAGLNGEQDAK